MLIDICFANVIRDESDHPEFSGDRNQNVARFNQSARSFRSARRPYALNFMKIERNSIVV